LSFRKLGSQQSITRADEPFLKIKKAGELIRLPYLIIKNNLILQGYF